MVSKCKDNIKDVDCDEIPLQVKIEKDNVLLEVVEADNGVD